MKNQKEFQMVTLIVVGFLLVGIAPTKGLLSALWTGAAIFTVLWGVFLCVNFREIRGAVERSIALRRERRRNRVQRKKALEKERKLLWILETHEWFLAEDLMWPDDPITEVRVHTVLATPRHESWSLENFIQLVGFTADPLWIPRCFILELVYGTRGNSISPDLQFHLVGHPGWQVRTFPMRLVDLHGYAVLLEGDMAFMRPDGVLTGLSFDWVTRAIEFVKFYDSVAHYASQYARLWVIDELGKTRRAFRSQEIKEIREKLTTIDLNLFLDTLNPDLSNPVDPA